jgi:methyl-accepting chemotaxis protein
VRNLAQRSAEAAKEIKSLITASVERVEQGTTLVDQTGATMQEIVTSIKRVTDIMGEINSASREQSTGVNQVGEAVGQMDQVTQQNAALVEESAAAAESLKQQAQQLVSAVAVFKLGSEGLHHASASSQSVHKPVAHRPLIAARPAAFRKAGSKPAAASAPAPADKPSSPARFPRRQRPRPQRPRRPSRPPPAAVTTGNTSDRLIGSLSRTGPTGPVRRCGAPPCHERDLPAMGGKVEKNPAALLLPSSPSRKAPKQCFRTGRERLS